VRLAIFDIKGDAILFASFQAGLALLVMFCSGDAFFNQFFIVATAFVVFIFTGRRWHFVSGRAGQRIPARAYTMSRVTVPMPAEFSVRAPSFSGFVFMD
jgi:hypothetical protein